MKGLEGCNGTDGNPGLPGLPGIPGERGLFGLDGPQVRIISAFLVIDSIHSVPTLNLKLYLNKKWPWFDYIFKFWYQQSSSIFHI